MKNLSVVVPIYNTKPFLLTKCLDSILQNSELIEEVLLVDSSDNEETKKVLDRYVRINNCFRLIKSQKGVSHQRNVGIDNANCPFIAFIDSDDYVGPNYFRNMINYVNKPNVNIVYPQLKKEILDDENNVIKRVKINIIQSPSYVDDNNFFVDTPTNGLVNPVKLYRRDLIGKTRFREDISHGEDMIFNYELSKKGLRPFFCERAVYTFTAFNNENAARKRISTNFIIILKELLCIYKTKKRKSNKRNIDGILRQYNYLFTSYYYECVKFNKILLVTKMMKYRLFYLLHNFSFKNVMYIVFPFTRKFIKRLIK